MTREVIIYNDIKIIKYQFSLQAKLPNYEDNNFILFNKVTATTTLTSSNIYYIVSTKATTTTIKIN